LEKIPTEEPELPLEGSTLDVLSAFDMKFCGSDIAHAIETQQYDRVGDILGNGIY
jgi:hypothetical protein